MKNYMTDEEVLGEFINRCCSIGDVRGDGEALYIAYDNWWRLNVSKFNFPSKKFHKLMRKQFSIERIYDGNRYRIHYLGVCLKG